MLKVVCNLSVTLQDMNTIARAWEKSGEAEFNQLVKRLLLSYGRGELVEKKGAAEPEIKP